MSSESDTELKKVAERTAPIEEMADQLVGGAIRSTAAETGRTREAQEKRMGDHFAYMAVDQDPCQKQLDDYALSGETVEVRR